MLDTINSVDVSLYPFKLRFSLRQYEKEEGTLGGKMSWSGMVFNRPNGVLQSVHQGRVFSGCCSLVQQCPNESVSQESSRMFTKDLGGQLFMRLRLENFASF